MWKLLAEVGGGQDQGLSIPSDLLKQVMGPGHLNLDFLLRDREEREGVGASVIEATDN